MSSLASDSVMSIYEPDGEPESRGGNWWTHNIPDEPFDQHLSDCLPDDDPKDLDFAQVRSEFVIGHNPTLGTQERLDPLLLDVWIFGAVGLREPERNNGKTWYVALENGQHHAELPRLNPNLDVFLVNF